jgi:hypothetical protein
MSYKYWDYYQSLEKDFLATKRYVDFNDRNLSIYSIEYARIILTACAELDMVFKELCLRISDRKCKNITQYRKTILSEYQDFNLRKRKIAYFDWEVQPFKIWNLETGDNPEWWRSYNAVKHERSESFHRASLRNAIYSLAGLQIVLFALYKIDNNEDNVNLEYNDIPNFILPQTEGSSLEQDGLFIRYSV